MIRRIRIQNFRSLIDVDVELEPLTVLIGRSGTGKSNFVGAIRFLRDYLLSRGRKGTDGIAPLLGDKGPISLSVDTQLEKPYQYEVAFKPSPHDPQHLVVVHERLTSGETDLFHQAGSKWILAPSANPFPAAGGVALGSITGIRDATIVFNALSRGIGCYDLPGDVLQMTRERTPQYPIGSLVRLGNGKTLVETAGFSDIGGNYLSVSGGILDDWTKLKDWTSLTRTMGLINPSVESIDLQSPDRNRIQVGYRAMDKIHLMDVASESEGFRKYLATLFALYQVPTKQTVIFEHPENSIHPGALETLSNEFKRHVEQGRGQVILTTHSPQLLDHFEPELIRVVDIDNGHTRIGPLAPEQIEAIREHLLKPGELLTVDPARLAGQLAEVPA